MVTQIKNRPELAGGSMQPSFGDAAHLIRLSEMGGENNKEKKKNSQRKSLLAASYKRTSPRPWLKREHSSVMDATHPKSIPPSIPL